MSKKTIDKSVIENCENKISFNEIDISNGLHLKEILVDLKLSNSNADSKRLISQGAVKINDNIILNKNEQIKVEMFKKISNNDQEKSL